MGLTTPAGVHRGRAEEGKVARRLTPLEADRVHPAGCPKWLRRSGRPGSVPTRPTSSAHGRRAIQMIGLTER